jgi:hypothetical protein
MAYQLAGVVVLLYSGSAVSSFGYGGGALSCVSRRKTLLRRLLFLDSEEAYICSNIGNEYS